jgi:HrpA-like RNA helicase
MYADECASAHAAVLARQDSPACRSTTSARQSLPITPFREQILAAVASNQVVIIAGQTGCGKTTQVPQYLLEDSWSRGVPARVICTQPRRISAITVAERVASERGEVCGAHDGAVGYSIRLETKGHAKTALLFCTNGVLLRKLTHSDGPRGEPPLGGVTHIVVDEIHERDLFADFLMVVLRDLLPRQPHLRLVLMSATLNEELFSGYFAGAPVIRVPGFTHPVIEYHLEDILPALGYSAAPGTSGSQQHGGGATAAGGSGGPPAPPTEQQWASSVSAVCDAIQDAFLSGNDEAFERLLEACTPQEGPPGLVNVIHPTTGVTPLHAAAAKGREDVAYALVAAGANVGAVARDGSAPGAFARRFGYVTLADALDAHAATLAAVADVADRQLILSAYQRSADPDTVDLDLLEKLLLFIHLHRGSAASLGPNAPGAVLVFLPGWDEITRMRERLLAHPVLGSRAGTTLVLPLHSMVPPADQRAVFQRAPLGVRKIVLATNIAETAVTVDDCTCVVDCGRHKERSYDAYAGVATLQAAWISQASSTQRRGRAGRCRPGECYRLYSAARLASLPKFQLPEMQRSPLEELCLQVKVLQHAAAEVAAAGSAPLGGATAWDFLSRAVEPPLGPAVDAAVALLTDIGALAPQNERLTPLGRHLAALPLHPRVGKMLLFGALLGCLDPVLTVAAAGTGRSPFVTPVDATARRQADAARRNFADAAGGSSDHLASVAAFTAWLQARSRGGVDAWCARSYLSPGTMHMIAGLRTQLSGALLSRGIIHDPRAGGDASSSAELLRTAPGLVRAVLGAGMYPLVGTLLPASSHPRATVATLRGEKVRIHPSSVNGGKAPSDGDEEGSPMDDGDADSSRRPPPRVLAFEELQRGESFTFIRDCTAVAPHVLLLVCARLAVQEDLVPVEGGEDEAQMATTASNDTALMVVDDWLRFRVPLPQVAQLCTLRLRLATAFAARVQHAHEALAPHLEASVTAAALMLAAETGGCVTAAPAGGYPMVPSGFAAGRGPGRGGYPFSRGPGRGCRIPAPQRQHAPPPPPGGRHAPHHASGGRNSGNGGQFGRGRGGRGAVPAPRPGRHIRFEDGE